jgi:integrase
MAIYKRGNTWTVRLWADGKKIEKAVGPDRKLAEAIQKQLELDIAMAKASNLPWTGAHKIQKARQQPTLREAFAAYILIRECTVKPSTKRTYQENFRSHLDPAFGDEPVNQITKEQIARLQNKLSVGRTATRTNNVMNLLRSILSFCVEEGHITENPGQKVRRLREEQPNIDPLSLDELEVALAAFDGFYRPIFETLAWSGMRPNELKALRWSDIDWRRDEISISRGRVKGVESTVKTRSSKRIIAMHPRVRAALEWQKQHGVPNLLGYIFTSKKGQPINQHLDILWAKALRKAGIRHRPSYQLRHTWASMALEAGESPGWVARMLGHSDLSTLFRHYARFIPSDRHGQRIASVNGHHTSAPAILIESHN